MTDTDDKKPYLLRREGEGQGSAGDLSECTAEQQTAWTSPWRRDWNYLYRKKFAGKAEDGRYSRWMNKYDHEAEIL